MARSHVFGTVSATRVTPPGHPAPPSDNDEPLSQPACSTAPSIARRPCLAKTPLPLVRTRARPRWSRSSLLPRRRGTGVASDGGTRRHGLELWGGAGSRHAGQQDAG
ncbi:unnamed protein product [Urochloa humidicola]